MNYLERLRLDFEIAVNGDARDLIHIYGAESLAIQVTCSYAIFNALVLIFLRIEFGEPFTFGYFGMAFSFSLILMSCWWSIKLIQLARRRRYMIAAVDEMVHFLQKGLRKGFTADVSGTFKPIFESHRITESYKEEIATKLQELSEKYGDKVVLRPLNEPWRENESKM